MPAIPPRVTEMRGSLNALSFVSANLASGAPDMYGPQSNRQPSYIKRELETVFVLMRSPRETTLGARHVHNGRPGRRSPPSRPHPRSGCRPTLVHLPGSCE